MLAPVAMSMSMRCDLGVLAGRRAALEAAVEVAVRNAVTEFGGREVKVGWTRFGTSEDTLQRVLPILMERMEPRRAVQRTAQLFQVCKSWRRELEARGFCNRTVQLCSALGDCDHSGWLSDIAVRREHASNDDAETAFCGDAHAFLERHSGRGECSLLEWLQAASQEPDTSSLSRGAASTAQCLGLKLVQWIGKPQEPFSGMETLTGDAPTVTSVALSPDGKRAVSGAGDKIAKIWDTDTGAEVSFFECTAS